jgi:nicotinamidase-related amidase
MRTHLKDRGGKTALLVIDMQVAVVEDGWDRDGVIARIGSVVEGAREAGIPVVYVQHDEPGSPDMERGSDGWQVRSEIAPKTAEPLVFKQYPDSFAATNLGATLEDLGVGHLVLTGAQSDCCVRATTYRALSDGYDVTLVSDCHTTSDIEFEGTMIPARLTVAHVNAASPWIAYPETTSSLATHAEIITAFKTPALAG